jgi:hypothetical protein
MSSRFASLRKSTINAIRKITLSSDEQIDKAVANAIKPEKGILWTTNQFIANYMHEMDVQDLHGTQFLFWSFPPTPPDGGIPNPRMGSQQAAMAMAEAHGLVLLRHLFPTVEEVRDRLQAQITSNKTLTPDQVNQAIFLVENEMWRRASLAFAVLSIGPVRVVLAGSPTNGAKFPNPTDYFAVQEWQVLIGKDRTWSRDSCTHVYRFSVMPDAVLQRVTKENNPLGPETTKAAANLFNEFALIWIKEQGRAEAGIVRNPRLMRGAATGTDGVNPDDSASLKVTLAKATQLLTGGQGAGVSGSVTDGSKISRGVSPTPPRLQGIAAQPVQNGTEHTGDDSKSEAEPDAAEEEETGSNGEGGSDRNEDEEEEEEDAGDENGSEKLGDDGEEEEEEEEEEGDAAVGSDEDS